MKTIFYASAFCLPSTLLAQASPCEGIYLNYRNTTVAVGASHGDANPFATTSIERGLANVIDAESPETVEEHNSNTHVWRAGSPLELDFTFDAGYLLTHLHFWNDDTEAYNVDRIDFVFHAPNRAPVGELTIFPEAGIDRMARAHTYPLEVPAPVRFVNVVLSGTNGHADFNNMGFTGCIPDVAMMPAPADTARIAVSSRLPG